MESPPAEVVARELAVRSVTAQGVAWLVSVDEAGAPIATLLPVLRVGDTIVAGMARDNPHWRQLRPDADVLLMGAEPHLAPGPTAYQLHGRVRVHEDAGWLAALAEIRAAGAVPAFPGDAVGVEMTIARVSTAPASSRPAPSPNRSAASAPEAARSPRTPTEEPHPTEVMTFLLQMVVYLSVAMGAISQASTPLTRIVSALAAVAVMALSWALLASSKARFPLRGAARLCFEVVWFGIGVLALWAAGQSWLAVIIAFGVVLNGVARIITARRSSR